MSSPQWYDWFLLFFGLLTGAVSLGAFVASLMPRNKGVGWFANCLLGASAGTLSVICFYYALKG